MQIDYVLYKKGKKAYCKKIMCNFGKGPGFESKPLLIEETLYQWLNSKITAIREEKFMPFVYYDLYKEKMDTAVRPHAGYNQIVIYSGREIFEKLVDFGYLTKWIYNFRNLNLETNTSMTLFSFHEKLKEYFLSNDRRFIYSRRQVK